MSFSETYAVALKADEIELSTESGTTDISTTLDFDLSQHIQVFPNPASSHLFIRYQAQYSWTYQLVDPQGKLWMESRVNSPSTKLTIGELAAGIYILKINSPEGMLVRKIIVE